MRSFREKRSNVGVGVSEQRLSTGSSAQRYDRFTRRKGEKMNKYEKNFAERIKNNYPPGTRILLLKMENDPRPIEENTRGTVLAVDYIGTIHCAFDNGRTLGLIPGEDVYRKLTEPELKEEQAQKPGQIIKM